MNNIKTFEDACNKLKLDATTVIPDFSIFPEQHQKAMIAHSKLIIIAEALNDGWKPNWNDWEEIKYYPWFDMESQDGSSSGVGFSYCGCAYWGSFSCVGSRLCFKSREIAKYIGTQFIELYKDYFVI